MHAFLKTGSLAAAGKEKPIERPSTSDKKKGKRKRTQPWVEKYRPQKVDDVAHQDEVVAVLKKALKLGDLPNLLFYGPPGTGKTSTILAAAKDLFGDMYRDRVLELNSSDERGIDVIRNKVKKFSQLSAGSMRPDGKPCPPFKIIVLDEADSMTNAAQAALRRTMEKEAKTTRFCLICNYVTRIIEPITSRCAKFRFKPLDSAVLKERLIDICKKEEVEAEDEAMEALIETSEGDMRKAITYLQSASRLHSGEPIAKREIFEIAGVIPDDIIDTVFKVSEADSYEKLESHVKLIMTEGYSASQLINQLHDKVVQMDQLTDQQKAAMCERLAIVDKRLMDGADEYLQMMDLCTIFMNQICHAKNDSKT